MLSTSLYFPLVAFLLAHIHHIDHAYLVLVYDNRTQRHAHTIAAALHAGGAPLICFDLTTFASLDNLNQLRGMLLVTLLLPDHTHPLHEETFWNACISHRYNNKCIILGTPDAVELQIHRNLLMDSKVFVATVHAAGIVFRVWPAALRSDQRFGGADVSMIVFADIPAFVASHYWLAFCGRLLHLPPGITVYLDAARANPLRRRLVWWENRLMLTGFDVGLDLLLADRIGLSAFLPLFGMNPFKQRSPKAGDGYPRVRQFDARITSEYSAKPHESSEIIYGNEFGSNGFVSEYNRFVVQLNRFVVLAPRRMVTIQQQWVYEREIIVGVLLVITAGLLVMRWVSRWLTGQASSIVHLFFDTFCRLLSNSPAAWNGRSTAERWVLVVVAAAAILSGSLFTGSVFDRLMLAEGEPYYRTLSDLCRDGIRVRISQQFIATLMKDETCLSLTWHVQTYLPNEAYVVEEFAADLAIRHGFHYKLDQPFGNLPANSWLTNWLLENPGRVVLRRSFEHGFDQAFRAAANHSLMLNAGAQTVEEPVDSNQVDFSFLVVGWTMAGLAFVGEQLARVGPYAWARVAGVGK